MTKHRYQLIVALLIILSGFSFSQILNGNKREIGRILHNSKMFSEYVVRSDYDAIAGLYAINGKALPPNTRIIEGPDSIKKYWTLPEGMSTLHHKAIPEEISIAGEIAYDYGYYEGITKRKDGSTSAFKGKYVIVWKKSESDWKILLDIWNPVR